ncbi:MAG: riboflavin synthase [Bacteroidia bacterium]|nr:riboflavin synthase [Bacteroidia bacterium]NND25186.1 riboflavin synthase [Flavobacteriaceae bacterium]MBT8277859.1 riboflavin synthase [Bacteroidia bacterium]NNK61559.1 riboflavin synthase [Flavobacteriaceae bacterium]NNL33651.1 riboflavin synthase [Flavobacteriaceae bacterium]
MFTGIIEDIGRVERLESEATNLHITINCAFAKDLQIDQSVSHNGVCLTVVDLFDNAYKVTAIQETLNKSNLGQLSVGDKVNLERGMVLGERLDGHLVQGHVDQIGTCIGIKEQNGSWEFSFKYDPKLHNLTIPKGSITVNGVSLTVVNSGEDSFSVAIIPFTFEHTNFKEINKGSVVNLEFDVIGKYVSKLNAQSKH